MARYRLLAGKHIQEDLSAEPVVTKDPATGKDVETYPSRSYKAGDEVDSDVDLVDKFGVEKFQLLGEPEQVRQRRGTGSHTKGDPAPEIVRKSPAVAPDGQVSTGFQEAQTNPRPEDTDNPEVQSHGLSEGKVKELEGQHMEEGKQDAKEAKAAEKKHTEPNKKPGHAAHPPHHKK